MRDNDSVSVLVRILDLGGRHIPILWTGELRLGLWWLCVQAPCICWLTPSRVFQNRPRQGLGLYNCPAAALPPGLSLQTLCSFPMSGAFSPGTQFWGGGRRERRAWSSQGVGSALRTPREYPMRPSHSGSHVPAEMGPARLRVRWLPAVWGLALSHLSGPLFQQQWVPPTVSSEPGDFLQEKRPLSPPGENRNRCGAAALTHGSSASHCVSGGNPRLSGHFALKYSKNVSCFSQLQPRSHGIFLIETES